MEDLLPQVDTLLRTIHYLMSIGAPLILGVLFHGVAGAAALRSHQSGSGEQ